MQRQGQLVAEQAEAIKTIEGKAAPKGASLPVQEMAENLRDRMMAMPSGRRNWLLASIIFLVAAVSAMVWYAGRPDWRVLFSGDGGKGLAAGGAGALGCRTAVPDERGWQ